MSLDRRLTLLFILIVIVPLLGAGFIFQRVVDDEIKRRAVLSLRPTLRIARDVHNERVEGIERPVRDVAADGSLTRLIQHDSHYALDRFLRQSVWREDLDFLVVTSESGNVLGSAALSPRFVAGYKAPSMRQIIDAQSPVRDGFVKWRTAVVARRGERVGSLIGGYWIDDEVLIGSNPSRVELAIVIDGKLAASSHALSRTTMLGEPPLGRFTMDVAGGGPALGEPIGGNIALVAWAPSTPLRELVGRIVGPLTLLLVLALVATGVLVSVMSKWITRPISQLSERAKAIAKGEFGDRITLRAKGEVGELAAAFNEMSARLSDMIGQLSSSRAQLQQAVHRVGETLRSTHSLEQIMESLLNTAADAVEADAAVLWRFAPHRRELYPATLRGIEEAVENLPVGSGIAGLVADRGAPISRASEVPGTTQEVEPYFAVAAAAPIYSQDRIQGVIVVYREDAGRPFSKEDLDTLVFLTEQGGVALENVMLHEEAQRLSLTDGLTGVWNRRYFQMNFRQTLATAVRFERPFSVLMLDLDNFKKVNDTHGHQRGDAVLVEFSQRVSNVLREVDTFARYGGEEFVCLLSETDYSGAVTTAGKIGDVVSDELFGEPGEEPIRLTVSIGVSSYPRHGASFSTLIEAADQALYDAKQGGRDRVVVADASPPNLTIAK